MATFHPIGNPNKKVFKILPINVRNVIDENGKKTLCVTLLRVLCPETLKSNCLGLKL